MVKVIIVPNVKPTLLPCFIFHVRRGVWTAEENGGCFRSRKYDVVVADYGHHVDIKRNIYVRR
jgi:hypothetical protein